MTHFDDGGEDYATYRPTYPLNLVSELSELAPSSGLAVDVGCGTGQLSTLLVSAFERVLACDISADQIANAKAHDRLTYHVSPAHRLPIEDAKADVITAAQAAHWFDLDAFYEEARRVAAQGALLALISYGVMDIEGPLSERFQRFYWEDLQPYWPPERRHVETGYADLPFPFTPIIPPTLRIVRDWHLRALLGYVETWSAVKAAKRDGAHALVTAFRQDAEQLWGAANSTHKVVWPVEMRLGRLSRAR